MSNLEKEPETAQGAVSSDSEANYSDHDVNERALLRKLDIRLLPGVILLYLLSFLDRANVANARIEGLTTSINMTGNQYLTGLTLYFIGYVLFEIPCNIVLKRTTPRFWLPTLTLAFGIVATLLGVVQNLAGFFTARFFLGVAESGLFPGVVFYLSMWYRRHERQFRVAIFFSAASLAGAFGGILAFGIAHIRAQFGEAGRWRWIFIIEGLITVAVALSAYFWIANYPDTAKFLSAKEKKFIQRRLTEDSDATNSEGFTWGNVSEALKDPKCWLYSLAFHTMSLPLYTLSLFLPTIIRNLGYKAADAQLLTIPPYALATVLTIVIAIVSERTRIRTPFLLGSASLTAIGYAILISQHNHPLHRPGVSYVGTFFAAAGIFPTCALVLSWPATNVGGQTKRAVAAAMQISIGNLGAVIGTQVYRTEYAPSFVQGHSINLGYTLANMVVTLVIFFYLRRQNRKRDAAGVEGVAGGAGGLQGDSDPRWRFIY